jgi:putative NADH-flavin reductase
MKVLVLGATGGTGRHIVSQAKAAGHAVTIFDRKGVTPIAPAIAGHDAVISAIGRGNSFSAQGLIAGVVPEILKGMKDTNVRRLIFISAFGVGDSFEQAPLMARVFFATLLRGIYADKLIGEDLIGGSNLDWTVVRPVKMTDGPATNTYRAAEELELKGMPSVSRADVAQFIVGELARNAFVRKTVVVSQ